MNTQGRFKTTQGQTAPQICRKSNIRDAVHGGVAQDRLPRFRILSRFIFGDLLESTLGNNFCKKLEGSGWAGGKVEQKCSYIRGRPQTIPWWLRQKESACNAGELGLIPGSVRSPGEGNGYLQYSCLGNPMDRQAWWATVHGGCKGSTTLLSD